MQPIIHTNEIMPNQPNPNKITNTLIYFLINNHRISNKVSQTQKTANQTFHLRFLFSSLWVKPQTYHFDMICKYETIFSNMVVL